MERKRNWKQKLLAFVLSFAMIVTMMPLVTGNSLVMEADAASASSLADYAYSVKGKSKEELSIGAKEWCAAFVKHCASKSQNSAVIETKSTVWGISTAYVGALARSIVENKGGKITFVNKKCFNKNKSLFTKQSRCSYNENYIPQKGDLILFASNNDNNVYTRGGPLGKYVKAFVGKYVFEHIGIVYSGKSALNVTTIEGNTSCDDGNHRIYENVEKKTRKQKKGNVYSQYIVAYVTPAYCNHKSTKYDACTSCGEAVVDYAANKTKYSYSAMNTAYQTTSATTMNATPYSGNTKGAKKVSSGKILRIVASLKNSNGELWYKVADYGTARYIIASKVKKTTAAPKIEIAIKDVNITKGKPKDIIGTISSNYAIKKISYELEEPGEKIKKDERNYSTGLSVTESVAVKSSFINKILCGQLKKTSTLTVKVEAIAGEPATGHVTLKVSGSAKTLAAPKIQTPVDIEGGKMITITQAESGATLKYSYGGTTKTTTNKSVSFPLKESANVTAVSSKGSIQSSWAKRYVEVKKLSAPSIKTEQRGNSAYVTIKDADSKAELYYAADGGYKKYTGAFKVDEECTVNAYAKRKGYISSDTSSLDIEFSKPSAPVVKIMNEDSGIAVGRTLTVGWEQDKKAVSSTAKLYYGDDCIDEVKTDRNTAAFTLTKAGEYRVAVISENDFGVSEESDRVTAVAKEPLNVVFKDASDGDEEGAVLASLTVEYGDKVDIIQEPARKGYNFTGWENAATGVVSINGYTKNPVKEDITYVATYSKKTYTVKFYDTDGSLLDTQSVKYKEAADDTKAIACIKGVDDNNGFVGWSVIKVGDDNSEAKISCVDTDMSLQAVVKWKEADLPVSLTIKSANLSEDKMSIEPVIDIATDDTKEFSFYLIAALKAEKDGVEKTVYVDRKIVTKKEGIKELSIGAEDSGDSFKLKVTGVTLSNVTKLEIMAVKCNDDNTTGGAYSKIAGIDVDYDAEWSEPSEWSEIKPEESHNKMILSKIQYQGRNLETVYSAEASLGGEKPLRTEYYNASTGKWTTAESPVYGSWRASAPSTSNQKSSDGTYRTIVTSDSKDVYRSYAYYCDCKKVCWKTSGGVCKYCGGKTKNLLMVYSANSIEDTKYNHDSDGSYTFPSATIDLTTARKLGQRYCITYKGSQVTSFTSKAVTSRIYLWNKSKGKVYRTKTVKARNVFTKYGDWSEWKDTELKADEIKTRTLYSYRELKTSDTKPAVEGEIGFFEGKLDVTEDLKGKVATVMIYQANNFDPNRYQMQYVDQITIGEGNTYSFSYIPMDKLDVDSGNYVVSLGVEGSTGLVTVGIIEAPKREYEVSLYYENENGEKVSIGDPQRVKEHGDADMTGVTVPDREGYYFIGWDQRTTDITSDCEIKAIYVPLQNAVVFVDWVRQTVDMQRALTGEKITVPGSGEEMPGYTFKGWKLQDGTVVEADSEMTVTGDMIVTAEYDVQTYTVKFMGADGNVLDTQNVTYGESAEPPETVSVESGKVFLGWSDEHAWWNVSEDMEVKPIIAYDRTAATPEAVIDKVDDYLDSDLELKAEDGAKIYYTTDGTDPQAPDEDGKLDEENSSTKEYDGNGLDFTEDTTIKVISVKDGKNVSDILEVYFEYNHEDDDYSADTVWDQIGECNVVAEPGKEITINLKMEKNPGLIGYHFLVECDRGVFYVDYDEENGLVCEPGEASANGSIFASDYEDLGWQILWFATEENRTNGSLFKLKLKVADDAEAGVYPVKISYAASNTFTGDEVEADLGDKTVSVDVESDAGLLGDANGDGSVTTMDVLRIARYVVGLAEIDEDRMYLADVNQDGTVTIADAILLARNIVGLA